MKTKKHSPSRAFTTTVRVISMLACLLALVSHGSALENIEAMPFPRLLGMNIGAKNYDDQQYQQQLAQFDAVILGFYPSWRGDKVGEKIKETVLALKKLNPQLLVGQYTVLNEAPSEGNRAKADITAKIDESNWWARSAEGNKVQWTSAYRTWEVNNTQWSKVDSNGDRYPEWLAKRDNEYFFSRIPFDIWYFDNVMWRPRMSEVDWNGDGFNQKKSDTQVQNAYRLGNQSEWTAAKKLQPDLIFMGNADNDLGYVEYTQQLQGSLQECLIGKSWSVGNRWGWPAMMDRYRQTIRNTLPPKMVIFHACGDPDDKRFFRYAFASSLLDNGWFSFTDIEKGYSSVSWFDEYDIDLGRPAQEPVSEKDSNGLYVRKFEYGTVYLNTNLFASIKIEVRAAEGEVRLRALPSSGLSSEDGKTYITVNSRDGVILQGSGDTPADKSVLH